MFGNGGAVFNGGITVTTLLNDSLIISNASGFDGGVADLVSGTLSIDRSTIDHNTASVYGGGLIGQGPLEVINSTVSGNSANTHGGGSVIDSAGFTTTLRSVTLAAHTADSDGNNDGQGGLYRYAGTVALANSLIANNFDHSLTNKQPDCSGTYASLGYNLIMSATGCTLTGNLSGVITATDPLLGPQQDNGGSTWTQALLAGSPAIDAGDPNPASCPSIDQRGVARPMGPRCGLGAYEALPRVYLPLVLRQ